MMAAALGSMRSYRPEGFGTPLAARPAAGESLSLGNRLRAYEENITPAWHRGAIEKVIALVGLPNNWDSYGSAPLRRDTAFYALEVLNSVMQPRTPVPAIVPSATGVQIEWHEKGIDLEIHVSAPYAYEIWFDDHTNQHPPIAADLSNDFTPARKAVAILTGR